MKRVKHLNVSLSIIYIVPEDMTEDEAMEMLKDQIPQTMLMNEDCTSMIDNIFFSPSNDDE